MPTISCDITYLDGFLNFTAYRAKVPKARPAWKNVQAPKLPDKEPKDPRSSLTRRPPPRPKINASIFGQDKETSRITDVTDTEAAPKTEAVKSPKNPKSPEAAKSPKNPKSPEAAKSPKNPKSPEAVKSPKNPKSPEAVKSPKTPKSPEAAKTPKTPEPTSAAPKKITT